jgi:Matrixin
MRRPLFAVYVLALALSLANRPSAQVIPPQLLDLADASSIVLTGRISSVSVQQDAGGIYTYATVAVTEVLKGEVRDTEVVVKQLGGTLADIGLYIADQASFAPSEDVLLFLNARPRDGTLYVVGLSRGKWQILPDLQTGGSVALSGSERVAVDDALRSTVGSSQPHAADYTALPQELQVVAPSFTFIPGSEGGPARWHEADDGGRIPVDYQTIPGGLPGGGSNQLDAALGSWNGVGTRLQLDRGASGSAVCPASNFTGNGRIALYWNDPCGEVSDSDSATFGLGGGFFTPGFQKTINGVTFNKFLQGLAILNNVGPHLSTAACLQDAVTHVLGHAVGFGHSSNSGAVMFATLRPGCSSGSAGLGSDDIDGLRFIYPAVASGGHPPNAPTAIASSVVLDSVTLSWSPATTGGPAQSFTIEASYGPGQPVIATLNTTNATPSLVVGGVQPGSYFVRVQARNALGTSAFSPGTTVTVGPCTAPGTPTSLAYSTADNLVSLRWTPPASGLTQGYWLYAGTVPGGSDALVAPLLGPTPSFFGPAVYGTYYVRIAARNSCAVGPASAELTVAVRPCTSAPNAPTGLTHTRNGNVVTLNWNAPVSGNLPSRYVIVVGSAPGGSDLLAVATSSPATSFVASAPAGRYFVRVLGRNNCGDSTASDEIQVVVP